MLGAMHYYVTEIIWRLLNSPSEMDTFGNTNLMWSGVQRG